ncbi:MAG TPA: lysophospholipid acyltransferase family protein [Nitrospirota bacterium]|nr:lysophospholipid acyltransferase family protein [Nitrospirota bacterium]
MLRVTLKLLGALPLLISYLLISASLSVLMPSGNKKRLLAVQNSSLFARVTLRLLGIRVHVKHAELLHKGRGGHLVIVNHLSYVDVLVMSSLMPAVFITSVEMKHTLLLGTVAKFGGSIFVERRKTSGLKKEIESIAHVLGQGFSVVLFPEGTTSNGERVQPFKNSLFDSAIRAKINVFPFCLRYTKVNNRHITSDTRDSVFFYGDMTFFRHLPRLLALQSVDLEVRPLETIRIHADASRKVLASEAHDAISAAYHGLAD